MTRPDAFDGLKAIAAAQHHYYNNPDAIAAMEVDMANKARLRDASVSAAVVHHGMNIDEGLVTPAPYTTHPEGHRDSIPQE